MKQISVTIPFESTTDQTNGALKRLLNEVYKNVLGRPPSAEDVNDFSLSPNIHNSSIKDLYFNGKRIGCIATTYILDMPRSINIDFTTHQQESFNRLNT